MTKPRPVNSFEDAIDRARVLLGDDAPTVTGRSVQRLRRYGDPDDESQIPLHVAFALDAACKAAGLGSPILEVYRNRLEGITSPAGCLDSQLRRLTIEVGELSKAADEAMADGVLDHRERRGIEQAAQDVIDQATQIRALVETPATYPIPVSIKGVR